MKDTDELMQLASTLRGLGNPRVAGEARTRIWQNAQAQVALAQAAPARSPWYGAPFFRVLVRAVAVLAIAFVGTSWLLWRSVPGDGLYPVAQAIEARSLALLPAAQRPALELQLLNRRAASAQRLAARRAEVPPELVAEIAMAAGEIAAEPEAWGGKSAAVGAVSRQMTALQSVASAQPGNRQVAGALQMAATAQRDLQALGAQQ
ncbi:MAG: hypothetical protein JW892_09275 [Anaerolineae bacterium]|nr:hypothetical protein [Anaerolineae bacterium]